MNGLKLGFSSVQGKLLLAVFAVVAGLGNANAMDTADVITAITAAVVSVGVVGVAILGVKVAVAAFKWVRSAIS